MFYLTAWFAKKSKIQQPPKIMTKNQTETDKSTSRPWHVNTLEVVPRSIHAHRGVVAEVSKGTMQEVSADEIEANARLIVRAVNEHSLLCAVAEAADDVINGAVGSTQLHLAKLSEALNALGAFRNGGGK